MIPEERKIKDVLYLTRESFKVAEVPEPEKEALFLLAYYIGCKPMEVHLKGDEYLSEDQFRDLSYAIRRRFKHEPHQYIVGFQEFYGYPFKVDPGVLIPRPETELLVDEVVREAEKNDFKGRVPLILDLCTGSGAVAIALAREISRVHLVATDISHLSIKTAGENVLELDVSSRVALIEGYLFEPLKGYSPGFELKKDCRVDRETLEGAFDIIVSNPPYVTEEEYVDLSPEIRDYEPKVALIGGADGLSFIREIISGAPAYLRGGGLLVLEVGYSQALNVAGLIEETGRFVDIELKKDLSGIERVVKARLAPRGV